MKKKVRRLLSAFLSVCLLINAIPLFTVATNDREKCDDSTVVLFELSSSRDDKIYTEILQKDEYFSKDEIIGLAEYHNKTYLEGTIGGQDVFAGEDIVPLYYTDDRLATWFVPYLRVDGEVAGYIIIGSELDSYNFYGVIESPDNYHTAKKLYDQGKELIFVPPMDFIYKNNDMYYNVEGEQVLQGDNEKTTQGFSGESTIKEIPIEQYESILPEDREAYKVASKVITEEVLTEQYEYILNDDIEAQNRAENLSMLQQLNAHGALTMKEREAVDMSNMPLKQAKASKIDARLVEERVTTPYFLKIKEGNTYHYGGNQDWFANVKYRLQGCGTVAAANITAYLARYKTGKSGLYTAGSRTNITMDEFHRHMSDVLWYVTPGATYPTPGILPNTFVNQTIAFALQRNVSLSLDKYNDISERQDFWKACDYIIQSLNDNRPVAMCMLGSNGFAETSKFNWHWMTITKYFQDTSDMRWVAFSSWGTRYSVNFRLMHNYQNGPLSGVGSRIISFK